MSSTVGLRICSSRTMISVPEWLPVSLRRRFFSIYTKNRSRESTSSADDVSSPGGPRLIECPNCRKWKVVRRVSKLPWSEGKVFYCCPAHKYNGDSCGFFYWEDKYMKYIDELGKKEESDMCENTGRHWEWSNDVEGCQNFGQKLQRVS